MIKGVISLGIFILIAIVAWWTITTNFNTKDNTQLADEDYFVVAYMNDFEMTAMDTEGSPAYTLKGAHMERYNNSDNTKIQQPVFQLLQANKQWKISADSAIVNDKNATIQLNNNVIMQQHNIIDEKNSSSNKAAITKNTKAIITIHTPNLLIHTRKQIAETRAMVNITHGNSQLSSIGMIFNNITNELELSSDVHGNIIPND